jgi:hypothetical protein
MRCHKWHEPDEGVMVVPEATGPLSAMRQLGARLMCDESAMRFICHRCRRIRRITQYAIFGALALLILVVLVLDRLGVLRHS